jgi:hypothetical protein
MCQVNVRCECIEICYTEAIEYLFQVPLIKIFLNFSLPLCFPELSQFYVLRHLNIKKISRDSYFTCVFRQNGSL